MSDEANGIEHGRQYASGMPVAGTVGATGAVGTVGAALASTPPSPDEPASQSARTAATRTRTPVRRNAGTGSKSATPPPPPPAPDPNSRTLTITLPKEVVEWYEKEAAAAPFEPSVQKFVAWELRTWMKGEIAAREAKQTVDSIGEWADCRHEVGRRADRI